MRYLIVNADDYGFSDEINRGICDAFKQGIVTDCSLLVHSPFAEHAVRMAQEIGLPVGIHLDLVTSYSMACSKHFRHKQNLREVLYQREVAKYYGTTLSCDLLICMRDEMRAQIGKFLEMTGKLPSHLDYHYGLHYLPEVMAIYVAVAEEFGLPIRWGSQYAGKNPYWLAPSVFCDQFRGLQEGSLELLLELLRTPWENVMEMVCHPGYSTAAPLPDTYNLERELELQALTSALVKEEIDQQGIQLIGYSRLKEGLIKNQEGK